MVRIDYYLFGYREITVEQECMAMAATILLRLGISSKIKRDGSLTLFEADYVKFAKLATCISFSVSEKLGIISDTRGLLKRAGTLSGIILGIIMFCFLSGMVFDVRVNAEDCEIDEQALLKTLDESGISVGKMWRRIDIDKAENALLSSSMQVGWVSIYRQGNVAYVKVMEKEGGGGALPPKEYGNIVALADGVIEEITVTRGVAKVSPGDVVKKGDLLISGIYDNGAVCRAEGIVIGRVTDNLSVTVGKSEKVKSIEERKRVSKSIQILGININIFKNYGNLQGSCDIIKENEAFRLFGTYRLPVFIITEYADCYVDYNKEYTEAEQIEIASVRMAELLREAVLEGDLIKLKTEASFTDNGYTVNSRVLISKEIGEYAPFSVGNG